MTHVLVIGGSSGTGLATARLPPEAFAAVQRNHFMTGSVLHVDGGRRLV